MSDINYIANLFKERNNPSKIGVVIGEIVEVIEEKDYVKVSILDGTIQKDKFYSLIQKFTIEDIGKKVIVTMTENNQELIILGYFKEFLPLKE
ncbi:hypothetical protein [[Clostridium] colinum]|uniref:hypothetical protein n=1 Tax=[Clostridium] colinum TaxID=36835 RepID=UPI0020240F3C|nr:hypothetical protein [[Clostridium] colinum]